MLNFKFLQKIIPKTYSFLPFYLWPESSFPPFQVFFEVTYRCNLRCDMCHYLGIIEDTETKKKYKNEMSAEEVKRAIATLPRHTLITFTGGEAFMKSDFLEILKFACSKHKVHVITKRHPAHRTDGGNIDGLKAQESVGSRGFSIWEFL